jgi:hypothetical protein
MQFQTQNNQFLANYAWPFFYNQILNPGSAKKSRILLDPAFVNPVIPVTVTTYLKITVHKLSERCFSAQ